MKGNYILLAMAAMAALRGEWATAIYFLMGDVFFRFVGPKLYMWLAEVIDRAIPGPKANTDVATLQPEAHQESTSERMLRVKRELAAMKKH